MSALILNDRAGRLLAEPALAEVIRDELARAWRVTELSEGSLPERIGAARALGASTIVVAGGDGTVACVCQTLGGTETALGIVPLGTMNLLARDVGMPADDIGSATAALLAAKPRAIDLGRIGEHVFACACMLGTPARIGHHREAARRRGHGLLAWALFTRAALRTLWRDRPMRLSLIVDGQAMRLRTRSLTITVNEVDDESGRMFSRKRLDGGQLCVYAERTRTAWDALRLVLRLTTGTIRDPSLLRLAGAAIEVVSPLPCLRILIDGEEHLLPSPLRFEIWPRSLRVLFPPA